MRKFSRKDPYILLWLLLATALIVFIIISFTGGFSIGSYTMKEGSFKDQLLSKPDTTEEIAKVDSIVKEPEKPLGPDTTVKSILVFGDSNTGMIARRLADYGAVNGYKVTGVTWDGSSSILWAKTDKLDEGLKAAKPDFIVISLGGNESKLDPKTREPYVKKVIERLNGIPFLWLGPGGHISTERFDDMLRRVLPENAYFNHNMKLDMQADHIHPTQKGANVWIDSVMRWMPKSHHPIPSEKPDETVKNTPIHYIYYKVKGERRETKPDGF